MIEHLKTLLIIVGTSGAGKSKALDAISDCGFATLENVPVELLGPSIEVTKTDPARFARFAILPDIRSTANLEFLLSFIDSVQPKKNVHLIYIDCADEVIIRRYSETRRPHPSFDPVRDKTLEDAILRERTRLSLYRDRANLLLDTTTWNIHELRRALVTYIESISFAGQNVFRLNFLSFGFKHGLPGDCDMVIDARFLPNPYFIPELREKDGTEKEVAAYVLNNEACQEFLNRYTDLLKFTLPLYINSGKQYLNVGIGCTGGKHRSVAIAEELSSRFDQPHYFVSAKHRDREK